MIDKKYHFEGRDKNGRKIIIDISREGSAYEVMALYTNGNEIASGVYSNLYAAERAYNNMITLYALKDGENPPLKGKYATLRDDLRAALKIAEEAAAAVEDSGTCNMDAAAIRLPRWRESLVEQAAEEAGTGCFKWESFGGGYYVFCPRIAGQAYKREIAAEEMTKELARRGYDTFNYQQMD